MNKKTIKDLGDLEGKRVLVRVDFNVPLDDAGNVSNDRRITGALPTLKFLLDAGASLIVMSHLGDPKGGARENPTLTMTRVAERLGKHLGKPVQKTDEVAGPAVEKLAAALEPGDVLVLENLRFDPGEKKNSDELARKLAALANVYVNDAFGTCHRKHASMVAVPAAMKGKPRAVGFLVGKELDIIGNLLGAPAKPMVGIMGGAKVSDKIEFIKSMLSRVDQLLVGGAMTYTFLAAQGVKIGNSRCEKDKLDVARELLQFGGAKIVLPVDHLIADKVDAAAQTKVVEGEIPEGWFGLDIGPKTIARYQDAIKQAKTVVWNGPVGKFEDEPFSKGTRAIAAAMAACPGVTVIGGGETAEAVELFGLDDKMTHVSTGGGAFLDYVAGSSFPALAEIDDR
ncbi:MAG: phosphoglycerate kinase [Gemmataceae bacterium]